MATYFSGNLPNEWHPMHKSKSSHSLQWNRVPTIKLWHPSHLNLNKWTSNAITHVNVNLMKARSATSWAPYFKKNFTDKLPQFTGRFCNHWPHINNMVTFQVPIRFRAACATTKEIKKKWKTFQKEHKSTTRGKNRTTTENTKDTTSCKRMCTWNNTRN